MSEVGISAASACPQQQEMPFAIIQGAPITELPKDLYIPPQALEVFLEAFEGPLDLLLYLIRRQNLDILDIPIAEITAQYMEYVELMKTANLELAAEYLVMAAMLAEIKSRMLLPRPAGIEDDESDPRAELVRRLQEYERYKQAADDIYALPRVDRDTPGVSVDVPRHEIVRSPPPVDLKELLRAMAEVIKRAEMFTSHPIQREILSVRERMAQVLDSLSPDRFTEFTQLFRLEEGKRGAVVTLLALLELLKQFLIELVQTKPFAPMHIKLASASEHAPDTMEADSYD